MNYVINDFSSYIYMLLCKSSHAIFDFCNFLICIICAFYKYYTVTTSAAAPFRITLKSKQYLSKSF